MRNSGGEMLFAISFPLQVVSAIDVEMKALHFATKWAMEAGYHDFQVETDIVSVLRNLEESRMGRWRVLIQEMMLASNRKHVKFQHAWREANGAAHSLAHLHSAQLIIFSNIIDLPGPVKRAYYMDKFSIPSIRL
ncbi:unnamed protein product [Cuscuta europaea]|uniref:RNase H type-1 domain-containing protein n=1 Tax=Cuscuta europaea TaxID=41803 RepID=A0A9P1DYX5_CUSEU|nr:unnamed protein product [Cuscuta europaea]